MQATVTGDAIFDVNLLTMAPDAAAAQIDLLNDAVGSGAMGVTHLELGNEFYLSNQYGWRFNGSEAYMDAALPTVKRARTVFPDALIAAVGWSRELLPEGTVDGYDDTIVTHAAGASRVHTREDPTDSNRSNNGPSPAEAAASPASSGWNKPLVPHFAAGSFDAITLHDYSFGTGTLDKYPSKQRPGVMMAYSQALVESMQEGVGAVFKSTGRSPSIWMTEFNVGIRAVPFPEQAQGALHGIFCVSRVLAAVNTAGWHTPFTVLMRHAMLRQNGTGWDSGVGMIEVGQQANDLAAAKVDGTAQLYAHIGFAAGLWSASAPASSSTPHASQSSLPTSHTRRAPGTMHGIRIAGGGNLTATILGRSLQCLQAAAFVPSGAPFTYSYVVVNRCLSAIDATLLAPTSVASIARVATAATVKTCTYAATDSGGWAPMPPADAPLPWAGGPLRPTVSVVTADLAGSGGATTVTVAGTSLAIVTIDV